ncbi:DNA-binding transcriptional LysR family regulator [Paraburkholderia sp. RAU6.4a]|uniref:LysR family transcriptional regulator n=2 Tax=unclassified Paraburkholderia TaxID=2615204 RepID=UPI003D220529
MDDLVFTILRMNNHPSLDLNLLLVFRAIWEHRNVSRAAEQLGVSQPSVSHALRALREHFNDRLFVRCAGGVMPTPLAQTLADRIAQALTALEQGLEMRDRFDAHTSRKEFTIVMTDIAAAIILPRIIDICRKEAPFVSFRTIELPTETVLSALRDGTADLAVEFNPALHTSLLHKPLFRSEYVCIVSADHPRIGRKLSRTDFMRERHAVAQAQGTGHYVVESTLQRLGLVHQIGARIPHFLALPFIIASSEMIATIPRPLAEVMLGVAPVKIFASPVRLPKPTIELLWHERLHDDMATRWLRDLLPRAMQPIFASGFSGFGHALE